MTTTKEYNYTWHLSLRVDRPVEGCALRSHTYMYGKKIDERDVDKPVPPHTKKSKEAPPSHEFSYRWFRGPEQEVCAYHECPRRKSFSPHDWSMHALGGSGCSLQCISTQSSLYKSTFCNSNCFCQAWKTQYTVHRDPQDRMNMMSSNKGMYGHGNSNGALNHMNSMSNSNSAASLNQNTPSQSSKHNNANNSSTNNANDDDASTASRSTTNSGAATGTGTSGPHTPKGMLGNNQYNHSTTPGGSGAYNPMDDPAEEEWTEIGQDQVYIPTAQDVGRKLKLEAGAYSLDTGELLMRRVVKTDLVLSRAPDPSKRNLVTAKTSGPRGGERFRIVTYNILAEIYATQQQYPYCDFWALSWDYRFQNILREILDACPDIICLQEVQADYYETHIYNALSENGFEGVYKQKTRAAMGMAGKVDGCALFWRRSKFHLVESYSIEFNELAQRQATQVLGMNHRSEECMAYLNRLSKDNVAQLVVLELAQPSISSRSNRGEQIKQVCIANTHLYSNKDFPDVKLWQAWQLLQELETFVVSRGTNLPLMICGDFNSTPDTAVYDLLSRQTVHPGHPDVNMNNGDDSVHNILPDAMSITHQFSLGSVYNTVMGEEPKATNYTVQFKGVLDYMWYSAQNLRPLSAAPIPDSTVLTKHGEALPSTQYSSDHVMLISDMQIMGGSRPPS